jgi:GNAT superfamily N-acetyltransferase
MTVRQAERSDLEAVQEVFRAASLSNAGDRATLLAHPEVLQFAPDPLIEGRTRVAVDAEGAVVGFATRAIVGRTLELEDLFVDPRRMRQGIGRLLVEDLLEVARGLDVQSIQVIGNPHAAQFYASVGFVPDGTAMTRFGSAPRLRLDLG